MLFQNTMKLLQKYGMNFLNGLGTTLLLALISVAIGCVIGALSYVVLYMLKTFVFKYWVDGNPIEAMGAIMIGKLIPSLINAAFGMVAAAVLYSAIYPALKKAKLLEKL